MYLAKVLSLNDSDAKKVIETMQAFGYIEPADKPKALAEHRAREQNGGGRSMQTDSSSRFQGISHHRRLHVGFRRDRGGFRVALHYLHQLGQTKVQQLHDPFFRHDDVSWL